MPFEHRVGFDQEHDLTEPRTSPVGHGGQFSCQDDERELLPARNVWRARLLPLENPQLLTEEQDLDILVDVGSTAEPDEIEQPRQSLGEKKEDHGDKPRREHAQARTAPQLSGHRCKGQIGF
jgi:hypothetical protein